MAEGENGGLTQELRDRTALLNMTIKKALEQGMEIALKVEGKLACTVSQKYPAIIYTEVIKRNGE